MTLRTLRVLFLSRRNTARSLMAEAALNKIGGGRFEALSARVEAHGEIDPLTARALASGGYDVSTLRPKLLAEAAPEAAGPLDFIFTLSDATHGEPMPEWVGHPISAHWSCEDPILLEGDEVGRALRYARVLAGIERRITIATDPLHR